MARLSKRKKKAGAGGLAVTIVLSLIGFGDRSRPAVTPLLVVTYLLLLYWMSGLKWITNAKTAAEKIARPIIGGLILAVVTVAFGLWLPGPGPLLRVTQFDYFPPTVQSKQVEVHVNIRSESPSSLEVDGRYRIEIAPAETDISKEREIEERLWNMFAADVNGATFSPQITVIARSSSYLPIGRSFSDEDTKSIIEGKQYVYFMGRLTYYDNSGSLRTLDYCALKGPFPGAIPLCKGHNGP